MHSASEHIACALGNDCNFGAVASPMHLHKCKQTRTVHSIWRANNLPQGAYSQPPLAQSVQHAALHART